jgi:hypothetical protein
LEALPDSAEYKVTTSVVFDREVKAKYSVTLTCRDKGEPSLTSSRHIDIDIVDINDHPPRLTSDHLDVYVIENLPVNSVVTRVNASDDDAGENRALHYSIESLSGSTTQAGGAVLSIDPNTGDVTTNQV